MSDLQFLLTGILTGLLMKPDTGLDITVRPCHDGQGYLPMIEVVGRQSGERVVIKVEDVQG